MAPETPQGSATRPHRPDDWIDPCYVDWLSQRVQALQSALTESTETLDRYLGFFIEKGYPGRACLRSGWVNVDYIAQDRERVKRLRAVAQDKEITRG